MEEHQLVVVTATAVATSISTRPLLLCSIGNPGPTYASTRHNAGHVMLELYRTAYRLPELRSDRSLGGAMSQAGALTLFQSGSYMNDSGSAVMRAYEWFRKANPEGTLCVMHDEMESSLGTVKMRTQGKGKGHNGIRSCIRCLGTEAFGRIAIGIGRPQSRESRDVTRWVLGRFTREEQRTLAETSLAALVPLVCAKTSVD